jgi:protein-tyrosine phosphatase
VCQPNFSWITPQLAIGGRLPAEQPGDLLHAHDIRAVVDLRIEACDDEAELTRHGIAFLSLPTEDHAAVSQDMLDEGVAFANRHLDRNERVLVHCEHGIGRSATLALCVLVSRGYPPLEALERAKSWRPLVSPSPAQFEAWTTWLARWRSERDVAWHPPHFDEFKTIAYRHLNGSV